MLTAGRETSKIRPNKRYSFIELLSIIVVIISYLRFLYKVKYIHTSLFGPAFDNNTTIYIIHIVLHSYYQHFTPYYIKQTPMWHYFVYLTLFVLLTFVTLINNYQYLTFV